MGRHRGRRRRRRSLFCGRATGYVHFIAPRHPGLGIQLTHSPGWAKAAARGGRASRQHLTVGVRRYHTARPTGPLHGGCLLFAAAHCVSECRWPWPLSAHWRSGHHPAASGPLFLPQGGEEQPAAAATWCPPPLRLPVLPSSAMVMAQPCRPGPPPLWLGTSSSPRGTGSREEFDRHEGRMLGWSRERATLTALCSFSRRH